jgi:hypothetical protein
MLGLRRSWVLLVALVSCGGAPAHAPEAPKPPPPPKPAPVVETADLSPVSAPAGLFVVGRLKRPTALTDTLAGWAGVPLGLRDVVPLAGKDLSSVVAWDAPVEVAAVVAPSGRRGLVEAGISIGLTSTERALTVANGLGHELKRLGPETYELGDIPHVKCAIAPAIGSAMARLVCSHRREELEDMLPYMTRGLPNEPLGQRDLELELRVEPLRQRFASELGSARLFSSFVVRELQLDAPRFDTALSDTSYALADEFVALVRDLDTLRVEATVDDQKRELVGDLSIVFGDHKSWTATAFAERANHAGPPPDKFFALPADAASANYCYAHDPAVYERLSAGLVELVEAYLEHEKVGKATRERIARVIQAYFRWDGLGVTASGTDAVQAGTKDEKLTSSSWTLMRLEDVPPALKSLLPDLVAIFSDRELRALAARTLKLEEKELPTARLVPLKGAGVPAGTRALVVKSPSDLGPLIGRSFGLGDKPEKGSPPSEHVLAVVVNGSSAVVGTAESAQVLGTRIGQAIAGKGATLATRSDLQPIRELSANCAGFATLLALLGGSMAELGNPNQAVATLPHHGQAPMFLDFKVEPPTAANARWHLRVPAGVFEDLPGLLPLLTGVLLSHS